MALIDMRNEVKPFLRVEHDEMDVALQAALDGCLAWLEGYCGTRFNEAAVPSHTEYHNGGASYLWPFVAPIVSVQSIKDMDGGGVVPVTCYRADTTKIRRVDGSMWGTPRNRYEVVYKAGYKGVPEGLKLAALQLMYRMYHGSGGKTGESAFGHSIQWGELMDSDIGRMLRPFVFRRPIG